MMGVYQIYPKKKKNFLQNLSVTNLLILINLFCYILIFFCVTSLSAQNNFDNYFTGSTMRIDFIIAGDNESNEVFFKQIKE